LIRGPKFADADICGLARRPHDGRRVAWVGGWDGLRVCLAGRRCVERAVFVFALPRIAGGGGGVLGIKFDGATRTKMTKHPPGKKELTPVDDVRRVRERLTREAGGDIAKLAAEAERVTRRLSKKLRLKRVGLANPTKR
jgi:hypothetical protein